MIDLTVKESDLPLRVHLLGEGKNTGKSRRFVIRRTCKTFGIFMNAVADSFKRRPRRRH